MTPSALGIFRASSFAPAFLLLPAHRRRALKAVYAFCRVVDDVVDEAAGGAGGEARRALDAWRERLRNPFTAPEAAGPDAEVWRALRDAIEDHRVDPRHLLGLVDGVARDLDPRRHETFEDLKAYCHGVASTVGLACLPLFGLDEPTHAPFAVNLGIAVQLTNILRDVGSDAARGRVYLPREDLRRFGYAEEDLKASVRDAAFLRLMRFEESRAREYYAKALAALPPISRPAARPALVMARLYRALLDRLAASEFDVFARRPALSPLEKLRCVGGVLWDEWAGAP